MTVQRGKTPAFSVGSSEPVTEMTLSEALDDLTGLEYDNATAMGRNVPIVTQMQENPIGAMYVLVTLMEMRGDRTVTLAGIKSRYTVGMIQRYFSKPPIDADDESPASAVGKD